jgi:diguanylate cyclase (GGDEF)-like protein
MSLTDKKTSYGVIGAFLLVFIVLALVGSEMDVQRWAEARVNFCREVMRARDELKTAELAHAQYMVTGGDAELSAFRAAVQNFNTHFNAANEDHSLALKLDPIRTQAGSLIKELTVSADVRQEKGAQSAQALITTRREARDLATIDNALTEAALYEVWLIEQRLRAYTTIIDYVRWCFIGGALVYVAAYMYMARAYQPVLKGAEEKNRRLASELQETRQQLDRLANVDYLTDVLNGRGLEQALAVEQKRSNRAGSALVAMLINCDNFAPINEAHGTAIGDSLLKEIARRMIGIIRPSDHIGRLNADEFLIILTDTQLAHAMRVADRLRISICDSPVRFGDQSVNMTVSIGMATVPNESRTVTEIADLVRAALTRSKTAGKNRVSIARDGKDVLSSDPSEDIVEVLCDGTHFRTVYQPLVDLATNNISGYEVFTRGPDGAFESPADFFRVCIENDILTDVDTLCLKQALRTVSNTQNRIRWHINVFPSTLMDTSIDSFLSMFPEERAGRYCVELSEEQFVGDPGYLREHVAALKQAGILVAIDDVGFGRSSLESLILLEPDIVKIDRKYVTGVSNDPGKQRLLKRVVNVAKSLGTEIVAEGIEVKDDLPFLRSIGVHYGQGYYWGELLEVLPEYLEARPALPM